jgi:hypothetical protein
MVRATGFAIASATSKRGKIIEIRIKHLDLFISLVLPFPPLIEFSFPPLTNMQMLKENFRDKDSLQVTDSENIQSHRWFPPHPISLR